MEFRQLEYFVSVAEMGSFTKAAQACHVVQTTISHSIASLEQELGTFLFVREGRKVSLSQDGIAFLPEARQIVGLTKRASEQMHRRQEERARLLRLGYYGDGLGDDFPAVIRTFKDDTGCSVEMRGTRQGRDDLVSEVRHGYLDALIFAHEPPHEGSDGLTGCVVAFNRVFLAMGLDDPHVSRESISKKELKQLESQILMFKAANTDTYNLDMHKWLSQDFGLDANSLSWESDFYQVMLRTRCGQCLTLAFRNSDASAYIKGELAYRRIEGLPDLPISLVWRQGDTNPLVNSFIQVVKKVSSSVGIQVL